MGARKRRRQGKRGAGNSSSSSLASGRLSVWETSGDSRTCATGTVGVGDDFIDIGNKHCDIKIYRNCDTIG